MWILGVPFHHVLWQVIYKSALLHFLIRQTPSIGKLFPACLLSKIEQANQAESDKIFKKWALLVDMPGPKYFYSISFIHITQELFVYILTRLRLLFSSFQFPYMIEFLDKYMIDLGIFPPMRDKPHWPGAHRITLR